VNEESEQTKVFPTTILLLVLTGWRLSGKLPGSSFPRTYETGSYEVQTNMPGKRLAGMLFLEPYRTD